MLLEGLMRFRVWPSNTHKYPTSGTINGKQGSREDAGKPPNAAYRVVRAMYPRVQDMNAIIGRLEMQR